MAAGTATATETTATSVKKIKVAWTSGSGGEAAAVTTSKAYDGKVIALTTIPTDSPTDNYDIVATDSDSVDVLLGAGANRDTANTEYVAEASLGAVAGSTLTFTITNAGNSKSGTIYCYIR